MRNLKSIIIFIGIVICVLAACKRESLPIKPLAALNAINAISDQSSVYVNTLGTDVTYSAFPALGYQSNQVYDLGVDSSQVKIFAQTDTVHAVYNQPVNAISGGIYSIYLFGQTFPYQSLLMKDDIPAVQDSSAGIRFINLSPDSPPIKAIVQGMSDFEVSSLTYKQISDFKLHSAKSSVGGSYTFEIRDAVSDTLLYTYTWYFRPFFCQTLVVTGLLEDNSFSVFSVNNF
jgi:hypothetical protein